MVYLLCLLYSGGVKQYATKKQAIKKEAKEVTLVKGGVNKSNISKINSIKRKK